MDQFSQRQTVRKRMTSCFSLALLCAALSVTSALGQWNLETISIFSTNAIQAQWPYDGVIQGRDGALYGVTVTGGTNSEYGAIYKVNPDGSAFKLLLGFPDGSGNQPYNPEGTLLQGFDGMLYGLTMAGGANGAGTIFKIDTNGENFSIIYNFQTNLYALAESETAEGNGLWVSYSPLLQGADGALYVTAQNGGTNQAGGIFRLNTNGTGFTILHTFGATANDGQYPVAGLAQGVDGVLYGATQEGGGNSLGTVFKLNTNGTGYSVLHSFGGDSDGVVPGARLIQGADGALYGTTRWSGTEPGEPGSVGVVFRLTTDGSAYNVLHNFTNSGTIGSGNYSALIQGPGGALYGRSSSGGSTAGGTIFRINPDGTGYAEIATFPFAGWYGPVPSLGVIQGSDGAWYGTTYNLGIGDGTLFRLLLSPPRFTGISVLPDHTLRVSLAGVSNSIYRIEVSTDLLNWSPLTNLASSGGTIEFSDTPTAAFAQRYYRAVWTQ